MLATSFPLRRGLRRIRCRKFPACDPQIWADVESTLNAAREKFCRENKFSYRVFTAENLRGFPEPPPSPPSPGKKKVLVTGSYDWFHSGHVRFLEEVSGYGDLYVVVGHDANIRLLKGAGHPLLPAGRAALHGRRD